MRDGTSVAEPRTLGITIAATPAKVYACVAATERWPELLPHYRRVRVLAQHGSVRVVEIVAWRDVIPFAWVAEQINDPERPAIRFRHVRGVTRGTDVQWNFAAVPGGTRVTVEQRVAAELPIVGDRFGERVVASLFLDRTARKTLTGIKRLVEGSRALRPEQS
jgi:ribosome-associated toxin RatA of RatAB toxin-antitoxin module